ncbi:MAG: GntR family transcriptional regulator, partial [Candidatus Dormibacteraeota bacterium]|nr:GntR family transcriptional regulator [Candidatus Dormibacteraeota bacterium]
MNVPTRYHIRGRRAGEIARSIERGIQAGDLPGGARLPTVRGLASRLGVSAATV